MEKSNSITAEASSDLIGNKIANSITKVSKNSPQNNSETIRNEHDKEIPKHIYLQKKDKIIDYLKLIY